MKANLERVGAFILALVATGAVTGTALAQDAQASGQAGMTLPGAAPRATATMGESDHDAVVGTLAVGYMGRRGVNVGCIGGGGAPGCPGGGLVDTLEVGAPIIGIRYWVDEMLGIDAGLGFGMGSTSFDLAGQSQDGPSTMAFLLHGGVPLSLADDGHFSFQVIPELNVGFGNWSQAQPGLPGDLKGSGFLLDIGARAGAEVHFGFMGLPKLALQGSIGLYLRTESQTAEDEANPGSDVTQSQFGIATTVLDNPWNIFTSNVAALYYF